MDPAGIWQVLGVWCGMPRINRFFEIRERWVRERQGNLSSVVRSYAVSHSGDKRGKCPVGGSRYSRFDISHCVFFRVVYAVFHLTASTSCLCAAWMAA